MGSAKLRDVWRHVIQFWEERKEVPPLISSLCLQVLRQGQIRNEVGSLWLSRQLHVCLSRGFVRLFEVALSAASHQVIPSVRSPGPSGDDVIDGHVLPFAGAILACEVISGQYCVSRKPKLRHRSSDLIAHFDHSRGFHFPFSCDNRFTSVNQDVGFTQHHQRDSSPNVAYVQRLIVAVQHQYIMQCHFIDLPCPTFGFGRTRRG